MTVRQRGTDSSGRPVKNSDEFWAAWDAMVDDLGWAPTIVKGGWLESDEKSASTHNQDALDVRVRDLTDEQRRELVEGADKYAFAYWERYPYQGFELHGHMVPGPWASPSPSALRQWEALHAGRDGLKNNGPDYHQRIKPLPDKPPTKDNDMNPAQENLLKQTAADVKALRQEVADFRRTVNIRTDAARVRDIKLALELRAQGKDVDAILAEVEKADGK